jgi:hypothetical protein
MMTLAAVVGAGFAATRLMDAPAKSLSGACPYNASIKRPEEDSPEAWAMSATSAARTSMTIGVTCLPMRLALHGTLAPFDKYVARLQAALCGGVAPRFDVPAEALESLDSLLRYLRYASAAVEATPVRTGLLVFRHVDRAPRDVRNGLKGLFDYGRIRGESPVRDLAQSPLQFVVAVRVPLEADVLSANVLHLMHHIDL